LAARAENLLTHLRCDVPYQPLLKVFLAERLDQERRIRRAG
jgi:hypothetical protein